MTYDLFITVHETDLCSICRRSQLEIVDVNFVRRAIECKRSTRDPSAHDIPPPVLRLVWSIYLLVYTVFQMHYVAVSSDAAAAAIDLPASQTM